MKTILDLNHRKAEEFFLRPHNYFSLALPSYFQFDRLLTKAHDLLQEQSVCEYYLHDYHPRTITNTNYSLFYNKDGEYAWRKYQIIHPFLYVEAVHLLTQSDSWNYLTRKVKSFRNPKIICTSMLPAPTDKLNKHEQDIFNWAGNFTNETVRKSLQYKYMLATDLTNCYDTLSFHLLSWALYGKGASFLDGDPPPAVGYQLQSLLQDMSYGQSCGIPQGSVLMDFLAEVILSYIDHEFYCRIIEIPDVYILRYRDDYRIFSNSATTARFVMKILVELLAEFNLKINLSKTFLTSDVIKYAFKPDRLAWQTIHPLIFGEHKLSTLKRLLLIRDFGRRYPNCGSLKHALAILYRHELSEISCHDDIGQITSVLADIMYINPGVWPHCIAILSKYIEEHKTATASDLVKNLRQRFTDVPNTEYLEIWLQRLSVKENLHHSYESPLCRIICNRDTRIWNSDWLGMYTNLHDSDIISYDEILKMPAAIPASEVALFITNHGSG